MKYTIGVILFVLFGIGTYAHWPSPRIPAGTVVDTIVVYKSQRKLVLFRDSVILKEYAVALGGHPLGPKTEEGDKKTPEGSYVVDYRKLDSSFHLALHISYPNEQDKRQAAAGGVSPGGLIMVHGVRNGFGVLGRLHRLVDWTDGCIAVTNSEIEEIVDTVTNGTTIIIHA